MALIQKAFSDIITFSRASNATRVGPDGLIQYAPHNLLLQSQTFDNASWTKSASTVTANTASAPDGTVTADLLSGTAGGQRITQTITVPSTQHTLSVYVKKPSSGLFSGASLLFYNLTTATGIAQARMSGETFTISSSTGIATSTAVGNGWYRITLTNTSGLTVGDTLISYVYPDNQGGGSGVNDTLLIWGAQLSVGPRALDYVPTTTAAVYGPRFDFDPSGVTAVQPIATNLITYSEQFDNAAWSKASSSVSSNTATAPDGNVTADKLVENSSTAAHYVEKSAFSVTSSGVYTVSVYAKAAERSVLQLLFNGGDVSGNPKANFDLATGTLGTVDAGISASIVSIGDGWYRCIGTVTAASVTMAPIFCIQTSTTAARAASYAGNGTSGLLVWGAQVELGSTATNYMQSVATNGFRATPSTTGSSTARGLLIEEQRTNLLTYSEQFDNAAWTKSSSTITPDVVTAPDGTMTADLFEGSGNIYRSPSPAATTYAVSVYVKAVGSGSTFTMQSGSGYSVRGTTSFNVYAGTVTSGTGTITAVGNGWYRCVTSITYSGAGDGNLYWSGVGTGIYIWGAQVEAGAFATSYIPTLAASVTRSADVATVDTLSPFYNAVEGTIYSEWQLNQITGTQAAAHLTNTSATDRIIVLPHSSNLTRHLVSISGVFQVVLDKSPALTGITKDAIGYKSGDYGVSRNGDAVTTSTYAGVPAAANVFRLGQDNSNSYLNGWLRRIAYYPRKLSSAELQALTA